MATFCHEVTVGNIIVVIVVVCVSVRAASLVTNVDSVLLLKLGHVRLLR